MRYVTISRKALGGREKMMLLYPLSERQWTETTAIPHFTFCVELAPFSPHLAVQKMGVAAIIEQIEPKFPFTFGQPLAPSAR